MPLGFPACTAFAMSRAQRPQRPAEPFFHSPSLKEGTGGPIRLKVPCPSLNPSAHPNRSPSPFSNQGFERGDEAQKKDESERWVRGIHWIQIVNIPVKRTVFAPIVDGQ